MSKIITDEIFSATLTSLHTWINGRFSPSDKTKLAGIEAGAQVNVIPNWTAGPSDEGYINNKPVLGSAALVDVHIGALSSDNSLATASQVITYVDGAISGLHALIFKSAITKNAGESDLDAINRVYPNPETGWFVIISDNGNEYVCSSVSPAVAWQKIGDETAFVQKTTEIAGIPINNGISKNALAEALGDIVNVQSDWNENDSSKSSFILNKPIIPSSVSDLTNDLGFQTASDVSSAIGTALLDYTNTTDLMNLLAAKADLTDIPINVSELVNDANYINQTTFENGMNTKLSISSNLSDIGNRQTALNNLSGISGVSDIGKVMLVNSSGNVELGFKYAVEIVDLTE